MKFRGLFFLHFLTRLIFIVATGFYNNYGLQTDSYWLVPLAFQAIELNFNFEVERFIVSPIFPLVVAAFKVLFGQFWDTALILFQLSISSVSGVYVYKIGCLLFQNKKSALIGSVLFAFYPFTLWYTHSFTQECIFQVAFILSVYYLLLSLRNNKLSYVVFSALYFSLAYLTKSHILLYSIFIPLIYIFCMEQKMKAVKFSFIYGVICLFLSLPYGLYQYQVNDTYVISSNGAGYQFYLGNTNAGYVSVVNAPEKGTVDFEKYKDIIASAGYFNNQEDLYDSLLHLPQSVKQKLFYEEAIKWIQANPKKLMKIKFKDLLLFIMPGVNKSFYSDFQYYASLFVSIPVFVMGYLGLYLKRKEKLTISILFLFLSMIIFSVVWYVQNRFRVITIEPFYLIYSGYSITFVFRNVSIVNRAIHWLESIMLKEDIFNSTET